MAGKGDAGGAGGSSSSPDVDTSAIKFCQKHTVASFPAGLMTPIVIDAKMSKAECYNVLADNHIHSAPVYDFGRKKFLGMISSQDVVEYLLEAYGTDEHTVSASTFTNMRSLLTKLHSTASGEAVTLVGLSQHEHFKPMPTRSPLLLVVSRLAGYPERLGVRRIVIVDKDTHEVQKVISQSAVCQLFSEHLDELGSKVDMTLAELGLGMRKVISVKDEDTAFSAFKLMHENNISAVAVVDDDGKLISNISSTDVRIMLTQNRLVSLTESAMDFVTSVRSRDASNTKSGKSRPSVVVVHPDFTVGQVIKRLAATGLHRVYVTDDEKNPVGVVSLKDIMHELVVKPGIATDWESAIYMAPDYVEDLDYL